MPFSDDVLARLDADAAQIIGQYPQARSALQQWLETHWVHADVAPPKTTGRLEQE